MHYHCHYNNWIHTLISCSIHTHHTHTQRETCGPVRDSDSTLTLLNLKKLPHQLVHPVGEVLLDPVGAILDMFHREICHQIRMSIGRRCFHKGISVSPNDKRGTFNRPTGTRLTVLHVENATDVVDGWGEGTWLREHVLVDFDSFNRKIFAMDDSDFSAAKDGIEVGVISHS